MVPPWEGIRFACLEGVDFTFFGVKNPLEKIYVTMVSSLNLDNLDGLGELASSA